MHRNFNLVEGKSSFNIFDMGKGKTVAPCVCKYNLDFAFGCISNINPYFDSYQDIVDTAQFQDISFDKLDRKLHSYALSKTYVRYSDRFDESLRARIKALSIEQATAYLNNFEKSFISKYFKSDIGLLDGSRNSCLHCYAGYKNNMQSILVAFGDFTPVIEQLKKLKKKDRIIRLGKTTECLSIFHLKYFNQLLDICVEYGAKVIAPTKFLYFDPEIARKLKATGSVIGYSVSYDELEIGPALYGFDTDYRLSCAEVYASYGVKVFLKMSLDCTAPVKDCKPLKKYTAFLEKNPAIGAQLIPLRIIKKKVAHVATGEAKKTLCTGQLDLFKVSTNSVRYRAFHSGSLIPEFIHEDFKEYFGRGICGKVGDTFYCDSCGVDNLPKWKLDAKKIIPVKKLENSRHKKRIKGSRLG